MVELKDIRLAAERLKGIITTTPLIHSVPFSEEYGHDVYIKPENLQVTQKEEEGPGCRTYRLYGRKAEGGSDRKGATG